MNFKSKLLAVTACLFVAVMAYASDMHKGSLQTLDTLQVNGKSLPAGDYKVSWEGSGPNVKLTILKKNQVVATSDAHLVPLATKSMNNATITSANSNGTKTLQEVRFAGKNFSLALGQSDQAQMAASDASK